MRERRRRRRLRRLPTRQVSSAGAEHSQRRRAQIGRRQRAEGERRRVHKASVSHRPRATRPIRLWPMRRLRRRRRQAAEQSQSVAAAAAASAVDNCDCLMSDAAARMCVCARAAHTSTHRRAAQVSLTSVAQVTLRARLSARRSEYSHYCCRALRSIWNAIGSVARRIRSI